MDMHHLVPQMWLKRFSDEREFLIARGRYDQVERPPTSVRKLCREKEFNRIELDSDIPGIGDNPHIAEELYCYYEAAVTPIFDRLETGSIDLSAHERAQLSFFLALQTSRTWHFRKMLEALFNMSAQHHAAGEISEEEIERFRREHPDSGYVSVEDFRSRLRSGELVQFGLSQDALVQQSLRFAAGVGFSLIHSRRFRLLKFEKPCLGISDNPIGLWSPNETPDDPISLGNALCYFVPIGRSTALSLYTSSGEDHTSSGTPTRAKQINFSVAVDAEKWLFYHPLDRPFERLELPGPAEYVDEFVSRTESSDGTIRERRKFARRRGVEPDR